MIWAGATGFATGFSLILAIGAQNAFVLRQGLLRNHVFWLCLLCATSDAILISAGVAGFGSAVALWPVLPVAMSLLGAGFLTVYGALRLRAAFGPSHRIGAGAEARGLWATLAMGALFTWANPHVYLDTLALIGAISSAYDGWDMRWSFGLGAMLASFVFFFALGYGARLLAPLMQSPRAWRVLDGVIALIMWAIAAKLLLSLRA